MRIKHLVRDLFVVTMIAWANTRGATAAYATEVVDSVEAGVCVLQDVSTLKIRVLHGCDLKEGDVLESNGRVDPNMKARLAELVEEAQRAARRASHIPVPKN